METWVPNPHARPYIPRKRSKVDRLCESCFYRRRFSWIFKACLLLTLVITLTINISFILNSNTPLQLTSDLSHSSVPSTNKLVDDAKDKDIGLLPSQIVQRTVILDVFSNKSVVYLKVDDKTVFYNNDTTDNSRGIHVLVLNQATAEVMAQNHFDTYSNAEDDALVQFLDDISSGRIIVLTIKDEGSFQMKEKCRQVLANLGSQYAMTLGWRDTWAFVTINGERPYGEAHGKSPDLGSWGDAVQLKVNMTLKVTKELQCPSWPNTVSTARRRYFCSKYEGYRDVCNCDKPAPIDFLQKPLPDGGELDVAVSVIASNRPHYLFRMLKTLLQTPGIPIHNLTVFVDGMYEEPRDVAQLFNIKGLLHTPLGEKNGRISQHYKASITATFELFPKSNYIILIEEDLDVSPDFFYYFKQTFHLLDQDPTLYCISAWNDQGYEHSCKDPSLLYRIETMPGLGWMMKKSLFMEELLPNWPSSDKRWDWDMWMRHNMIRKNRECIIPDISRTFHFGSKGLNINPYFQQAYFKNHKLQTQPNVKFKDIDRMKSQEYESLIEDLIQEAKVLDHSKDPCAEHFIPKVDAETFVMYIYMNTTTDFQTWKQIAKCYKLWDLDVRGFHKSMWRQFHEDKHLIIIGVPASPYAIFKPSAIKPIYLEEKKEKKPAR